MIGDRPAWISRAENFRRKNRMSIRFTTMILFILPLSLWGPARADQDQVPNFDVAKSCREAQDIGGDSERLAYKGCMQDESEARKQLVQNWSRFKVTDRRNCVAQGAFPMPSYVEILTCIEMYDGGSILNKGQAAPLLPPPQPTYGGTGPAAVEPIIRPVEPPPSGTGAIPN
jgi:hypothetical protein